MNITTTSYFNEKVRSFCIKNNIDYEKIDVLIGVGGIVIKSEGYEYSVSAQKLRKY